MKYSEGNKPLSHQIHRLMYAKQDEINRLQMRPAIPYGLLEEKRKELWKLEEKFARQIVWERVNSEKIN